MQDTWTASQMFQNIEKANTGDARTMKSDRILDSGRLDEMVLAAKFVVICQKLCAKAV